MPIFIVTAELDRPGHPLGQGGAQARCRPRVNAAKKMGIEFKHVFLTSGESDLLLIVEAGKRRQRRQICHGERAR